LTYVIFEHEFQLRYVTDSSNRTQQIHTEIKHLQTEKWQEITWLTLKKTETMQG